MLDKIISSKRSTVLLFIVLGFVCYGWILNSPFKLLDDYACIIQNPAIHSLSNWFALFKDSFFQGDGSYYRPLVSLSFLLEYRFFKFQYLFYNLDNILLHIGSSLLVLAILGRLLKDKAWAFYAALLFLIHPVNWEQITNIPGRSILLCAFFILAAFYLLLKAVDGKSIFSRGYYILSLAAFAAGLLSKESAVVFPLIVVFWMIFILKASFRRIAMAAAPYFILLAGYAWLRLHLGITKLTAAQSPENVILAMATFWKSLGLHAATLLLPRDLIYDRSLPVFRDFLDPGFWAAAATCAAAVAAIIFFRKNIRSSSWFWLAWIVLSFAPVSQLVPIYVSLGRISIADHFLYLPSVGIFVFLVQWIRTLFQIPIVASALSPKIHNILLLVWLGFLIFVTVLQTFFASDQFVMFEAALEASPRNHRVRTALGSAYGYVGMPEKAEYHYRQVLEDMPWDVQARIGLGKSLCDQNRCFDGIIEYHKVFNPSPRDKELLEGNLAKTYPIVIREYEAKVRRDPGSADFQHVLGTLYLKTGRGDEGLAHLKTALDIDPDFPQAVLMMANVLYEKGETDGAIEYYRKFLDIAPAEEHYVRWNVARSLTELYRGQGKLADAQHFDEVVRQEAINLNTPDVSPQMKKEQE